MTLTNTVNEELILMALPGLIPTWTQERTTKKGRIKRPEEFSTKILETYSKRKKDELKKNDQGGMTIAHDRQVLNVN
jgi:hypothetical protein